MMKLNLLQQVRAAGGNKLWIPLLLTLFGGLIVGLLFSAWSEVSLVSQQRQFFLALVVSSVILVVSIAFFRYLESVKPPPRNRYAHSEAFDIPSDRIRGELLALRRLIKQVSHSTSVGAAAYQPAASARLSSLSLSKPSSLPPEPS